MKRYVGTFKVHSGEMSYYQTYPKEANTEAEAIEYFSGFVCNNENEIWELRAVKEVKNFDELWEAIQ